MEAPSSSGFIGTTRFIDKVLNWSFERGIIDLGRSLSNKQKNRTIEAVKSLNQYRKLCSEVKIEEIGHEIEEGLIVVHI